MTENGLCKCIWKNKFYKLVTLLNSGANPNEPYNNSGWTPFMLMCKECCDVKFLIDAILLDANVNKTNNLGQTPLHIASKYGNTSVVELLVDLVDDIDAVDNDGNTALMTALNRNYINYDVVRILLGVGADTSIVNKRKQNAYTIAKNNSNFTRNDLLEMMFPRLENKECDKDKAKIIAKQNDRFRKSPSTYGQLIVTCGIRANGKDFIREVIEKVRAFDNFTKDNDPYGEHDFGSFEHNKEKIFWKIDNYDSNFMYLSPDVTNPKLTNKVLTVMLAEEY